MATSDSNENATPCMDAAKEAEDQTGMQRWCLSNFAESFVAQLEKDFGWSGKGYNFCELGCGIRPVLLMNSPPLKAALPGRIVLGDYNSDAVEQVRNSLGFKASLQLGWNVSSVVLDWSKSLPDDLQNSFEVVIACEVLYYAVDLNQLFTASNNLLAKGGLFILVSALRNSSLDKLSAAASKCGRKMDVFDIHGVNEELGGPAVVDGYNCFCIFQEDSKAIDKSTNAPVSELTSNIMKWKLSEEQIRQYEDNDENDIFSMKLSD